MATKGRCEVRNRNPYRIIRRALNYFMVGLVALLFIALFAALVWSVWTEGGWGAWALFVPILVVVGIAAFFALLVLVTYPFKLFGDWWKRRELEWRKGGEAV